MLRSQERGIGYAIRGDMSLQLHTEIMRRPECAGQLERDEPDAIHEWADGPYEPDAGDHRKARLCVRRDLAVRSRRRHGELFADGSSVKHFAIVTNRQGAGLPLIRWHRQKAGPVEHAHHVLTNDLAAAARPSGNVGATATWFRLNILTERQPAERVAAASLPRRFVGGSTETAAGPGVQYGWNGRAACAPYAAPVHLRGAADPRGPGPQPTLARK